MKTLIRALRAETAFPLLVILSSLSGLSVMGLANYARPAAPAWHWPMALFLTTMISLALQDLIRSRRALATQARRSNRQGGSF